jgi:hypothetical protein
MSFRSKSTLKMLCARAGIANRELSVEAQKLMDIYDDPNVAPEQKAVVKAELDEAIRKLEERVTTRKLKEAKKPTSAEPPAP